MSLSKIRGWVKSISCGRYGRAPVAITKCFPCNRTRPSVVADFDGVRVDEPGLPLVERNLVAVVEAVPHFDLLVDDPPSTAQQIGNCKSDVIRRSPKALLSIALAIW